MDNWCSNHILGVRFLFKELDDSKIGDIVRIYTAHSSSRPFYSITNNQDNATILKDVMHVPSLSHNLLSVGQLVTSGCSILFDDNIAPLEIKPLTKLLLKFRRQTLECFYCKCLHIKDLLWILILVMKPNYGIYIMSI